jgi:outer membrane protein TolC
MDLELANLAWFSAAGARRDVALIAILSVLWWAIQPEQAKAQLWQRAWRPEQRTLDVREPESLPYTPLPSGLPGTVRRPGETPSVQQLSLDAAIQMSLARSQVVRLLTGVTASTSGRTIFDVAVANTAIDEEQAKFDPKLTIENEWLRGDQPGYNPAALPPVIEGFQTDSYRFRTGLSKLVATGGVGSLDVTTNPTRFGGNGFRNDPLLPQPVQEAKPAVQLSFTQPLLAGAGISPNLASVVLARIETERSYFQLKDAMQELVRGTIEAYWQLVFARTDQWARQQQVEQAQVAVRFTEARVRAQISNAAELAQARLTLANFRATLIGAEANVLQREAALRNLLGLPPADGSVLVPVTPPTREPFEPDWLRLIEMAERQRPDLVELKLILEADEQALLLARNQALPQLDAFARYRWNGLEGELPDGSVVRSEPGQFTEWSLGINFSVPLGLRQARASTRRRELLIARDRMNLEQGLHSAVHGLALNVRAIDQAFEQYLAFQEAREAARLNLEQQLAQYRSERVIFLNVLQAITDWGNTISAEANALLQFNTQLANLERQSGAILETHGVTFFEERYASVGPLGRWHSEAYYPRSLPAASNAERYRAGNVPAEQSFDLRPPPTLRAQ